MVGGAHENPNVALVWFSYPSPLPLAGFKAAQAEALPQPNLC